MKPAVLSHVPLASSPAADDAGESGGVILARKAVEPLRPRGAASATAVANGSRTGLVTRRMDPVAEAVEVE